MAKKERKPTEREIFLSELGYLLMGGLGLDVLPRTKQGFVIVRGDKHLVVSVVRKKELVDESEYVEVLTAPTDETFDTFPEDEDEGEDEELE